MSKMNSKQNKLEDHKLKRSLKVG